MLWLDVETGEFAECILSDAVILPAPVRSFKHLVLVSQSPP
jgi:hypothetical protein